MLPENKKLLDLSLNVLVVLMYAEYLSLVLQSQSQSVHKGSAHVFYLQEVMDGRPSSHAAMLKNR